MKIQDTKMKNKIKNAMDRFLLMIIKNTGHIVAL